MTSINTSLTEPSPIGRALSRAPLTLEDVPALTALLGRIEEVEHHGDIAAEVSTREWLAMPGLDLEKDSVAVRVGEELVGFTIVDVHRELDRDGRVRCQLSGAVDPGHRHQGLGAALLGWGEDRAAELLAERHPAGTPAIFRTSGGRDPIEEGAEVDAEELSPEGGADVRPLLAQRGYTRVRSWLLMVRELPGAALPELATEGVRVIAPALEDAEATRLAHLAAFADHWGSAPVSAERWSSWWDSHTSRRELSSIAVDAEGTVLAYAIAAEDKSRVLHINLVGTRPEGRGRGLARAVLARTLSAAAEAGYATAELEVDAESITGATRLYDALGFARESIYGTYEKPVA